MRAHYGRDLTSHQDKICALFSKISNVAANNQFAWFKNTQNKSDLLEKSIRNRMVAFPYRKRLNSMIMVNQSAAIVMTSVARAKALGIPSDQWVYLHGYADGCDVWNVSERADYYSSPAIKQLTAQALTMANMTIDDIATFDIYSCFPSAVQIACDAMGIMHDDQRNLSMTGGLPYFGGPGNNYSMHAIAEMVNWSRNNPHETGLLNANGWYLTKHSIGVYSQTPPRQAFKVVSPVHQQPTNVPVLNPDALGKAHIETFTVIHDRSDEPKKAIIIARTQGGERCLATTDNKPDTLENLMSKESVGQSGLLVKKRCKTHFEL